MMPKKIVVVGSSGRTSVTIPRPVRQVLEEMRRNKTTCDHGGKHTYHHDHGGYDHTRDD